MDVRAPMVAQDELALLASTAALEKTEKLVKMAAMQATVAMAANLGKLDEAQCCRSLRFGFRDSRASSWTFLLASNDVMLSVLVAML